MKKTVEAGEKVLLSFSDEEMDRVAEELKERLLDLVYMSGKEKLVLALKEARGRELSKLAVLEVVWKFDFIVNDIVQVLGRIRRLERA